MLSLLRNYNPFTVLVLAIFTLATRLQAIIHSAAPAPVKGQTAYNALLWLLERPFGDSAVAFTFFTVAMGFGQALYLNSITVKYHIYTRPSYLPAFAFLALTAIHPAYSWFSPAVMVVWCLLTALDLMLRLANTQHPQKHIFNMGFVLGIAMLLQFSAVWFIIWFLAALIMIRALNIGEWVVGMLGLATPVYFFYGLLFLFDKWPLGRLWPQMSITLPRQAHNAPFLLFAVCGVLILLACGLFALQGIISKIAISTRRAWGGIIIAGMAAVMVALTSSAPEGCWLAVMPMLSLVAALPLFPERSNRFSIFVLCIMLAMVIGCQYYLTF